MRVAYTRISYKENIFYGIVNFNKKLIRVIDNSYFNNFNLTSIFLSLNDPKIKFLTPSTPSKIICLGLNFVEHVNELNMQKPKNPIIFLKPSSAIAPHQAKIKLPGNIGQIDYEGELAVVIKKTCKNIKKNNFNDYILGYTCFNDITARTLQKIDGQWTRAKSFDGFAPFGPFIVSNIRPDNLRIQTYLNNKLVQNSNTKNMIFNVPEVLHFISNIMTLYSGDIISFGTPPGIGPIKKNDKVTIRINQIGELTNYFY